MALHRARSGFDPDPAFQKIALPCRSMKIDYDDLKTTLASLSEGKATHRDVLSIVQVSRAIVTAYLNVKMSSLSYLYQSQGLSETDLAYDCIADLFRSNDGQHYPKVEAFTASLHAPFIEMPPVEVFIAFRGFLTRVAKGHIADLFYLSDPVGGKIHRNIRECVHSHAGLTLFETPEGLYLSVDPEMRSGTAAEFPREEMERALFSRMDHERGTGLLLHQVREILAGDERYSGRIRLFDLVQIFKRIFGADDLDRLAEPKSDFYGLSEADIGVLRDRTLKTTKEKIFLTYLGTGKLTRREAMALYQTVADIIDEWIEGSDGTVSLFSRLTLHLETDSGKYGERYRAKLEYLVKTARRELAALLSKEL